MNRSLPFLVRALAATALLAPPVIQGAPVALPPALVAAIRPLLARDGIDPAVVGNWGSEYATLLDVSADGVADWLLDFDALGDPGWCGTGGCRHQLWVSDGPGFVLALDAWVVEVASRDGGSRTLDVQLHGTHCARPGNAPCVRSLAWSPARKALEEVAGPDGGTLLTGPLFQPVPTDEAGWPEPVRRVRDATVDRCVAAGGDDLEWGWPASSIPDVDGDGARDWAIDESWLYCGRQDRDGIGFPARLHVFASNHGRWIEMLDVADADWAIDVSSRPASLVVTPQPP